MKRPFVVISMKLTIIVLISFVLVSCGGGGGGGGPLYSNATLTGTWMIKAVVGIDTVMNAMEFDGNGNIVANYDLNPGALPSPYTVSSSGFATIYQTFSNGPTIVGTGQLTSPTSGSLLAMDGNPITGTIRMIMDIGACQGTWAGTLAGAFTNSFQITVDKTGSITGGSGFTGPIGGKLFCQSSDATGLVTTGEVSPLSRFKFFTGTVISGATVTISGDYETNGPGGTYTLVK